ncbi:MAG: glycoside hydrolase family 57 protein [Candidatus Aminicenantes bacterium]|nr:glycoside hydrolase family 57 protein [Candidatus Aminicenantes bacterium]
MYLAILWHFHQPIYRRPRSRAYVLPWVNYHATKNYHQMARLIEETGFPCTFNFVPCLLDQIEDYAKGAALDPFQLALEVPPDRLGPIEIERLRKFAPDETRPTALQQKALTSFFSPIDAIAADKFELLDRQRRIQQDLIPSWVRLSREGKTELTVTPYYHPLLPMIFDSDAAGPEKPEASFRQAGDGKKQIQQGRQRFKDVFGDLPRGLWPSEGGMSREVAAAIAEAGFAFAVTDENILWKSLDGPYDLKKLYAPYRAEGLSIFFRDRLLSDLIGFEYQRWNEEEAVTDFLRRLDERRPYYDERSIVVLALDGENAWGGYRRNGVPFLREFFGRLMGRDDVTPIFFDDYLKLFPPSREISLVPGTWIGNFSKWSGSPAKNKAWAVLSRARQACGPSEELLIAEGSDWFWWFGDEHTEEFAFLFDSYIREAYHQAGIHHE